jgi:hypothetical protein
MTKKFTQLPAAGALTGTEILALVQGGSSKQATALAIASLGGGGWPNTINVKDPPFNAVGNGSADDTVALNAAFTSVKNQHALVLIPNGTYKITDTIVVGDASDHPPNSFVSIMCPGGPEGVTLSWLGPNDGRAALYFAQNKYFVCQGFALDNNTGSKGTSRGIRIGGNWAASGNTNQSIDGTFSLLFVRNFATGITDGFDGAASEMTFKSITLSNCDIGWVMNKSNSLNHIFINTGGANCGTVFDTGTTINFTSIGGSISQSSVASILIRQNCVTGTIRGLRDEDSVMCVAADVGGGAVAITDSLFGGNITGPFAIGGISRSGAFSKLTLRDCSIGGQIQGCAGFLSIENCIVPFPDQTTRLPFIPSNSDTAPEIMHVHCTNNFDGSNGVNPMDDFIGTLKPGAFTTGGSVQTITQYMPHFLKRFAHREPTPNTGTPYGGDYICLGNVRHLSEGPVTGIKSRTPQITAVTNAITPAGSNVLHFASVPPLIRPLMHISNDTAPGSIFFGTYVSRDVAATATTVTLNSNIQAPGVGLGDTIRFWPDASILTEGKNLRISGTFAASTTLAFTFVRSINVSNAGNGSYKLTANTGRFYPTDVGKAVKLVGSASAGWTDIFGFITNYIDSTHVEYEAQPVQVTVFGFTGTLTIGTNEPDANYIVLGVTSDDATPKTFSVTSITTTGFTITASAATSANVSALIVR